ncbi:MAG: polysaccharide deacetylase family protein [Ardenticatenaceae bacterium]|nr:polysaccharide deacetylase family protein [Ardenticatenaceae bacterium]
MRTHNQTNHLLGYPSDARLLIINADDLGMCHAVNAAVFQAFAEGFLCSATLMLPCAWSLHALHFLRDHPEFPFGVHLTAVSDWADYRWGPVAPQENVPSLINQAGHFYNFEQMPAFLAQVSLDELEMEFRAQIEAVLAAGLQPTHLDWHSLRISQRPDISDVMLGLAREYGLALRVYGRSQITKVQHLGLPCNDHGFLDSYLLDPATKFAHYRQLLRELPPGLSEWAIHPGLDNAELQAIDPGGSHIRQIDFEFLISQQAQDVIEEEGIILLDYRALQTVWRNIKE